MVHSFRPARAALPVVTPPGWHYNPSSWEQRLPLVGAAVLGLAIATYLTLYQVGVLDTVWEPFFGDGTAVVLGSGLTRAIGVPEAALAAAVYAAVAITGILGGSTRWRTMPWLVVLFGCAVAPFGLVSVLLVVLQPLLFDTFCTLCLASALISVLMIGPAMDEVLASLQHVRRSPRPWQAFWGWG